MASSYRTLDANRRYLRGLALGGQMGVLDNDERKDAEQKAAAEIETRLGKTFSTSSTPQIIRHLADLLGSAYLMEFAASDADYGSEDGDGERKSKALRKEALAYFDALRAGSIGIINPDDTWDGTYPQPQIRPTITVSEAKPVTILPTVSWGNMASPRPTEDEADAVDSDTRERRADADESSNSGDYASGS